MSDKEIKGLVEARDAALLSLDEARIRAYFRKYNGKEMPRVAEVFWCSVHKARTATRSLPMEARTISKRWPIERGYQSMDEGEVPV